MTPPDYNDVAVELANLRGEITTGLTEIKGQLAVLVERSNRTEQDVQKLRSDVDGEIQRLRTDVEQLKAARWPLAQVGAMVGAIGLVVGAAGAVGAFVVN